jgi:hypothetical protein
LHEQLKFLPALLQADVAVVWSRLTFKWSLHPAYFRKKLISRQYVEAT